jgi:hypothetical protein
MPLDKNVFVRIDPKYPKSSDPTAAQRTQTEYFVENLFARRFRSVMVIGRRSSRRIFSSTP